MSGFFAAGGAFFRGAALRGLFPGGAAACLFFLLFVGSDHQPDPRAQEQRQGGDDILDRRALRLFCGGLDLRFGLGFGLRGGTRGFLLCPAFGLFGFPARPLGLLGGAALSLLRLPAAAPSGFTPGTR